jgi:hypothetical protein
MLVMNSRLDASFDGFGAAGIGASRPGERPREATVWMEIHPEARRPIVNGQLRHFVRFGGDALNPRRHQHEH